MWLVDNTISKIVNLDHCISLKILNLAGNKIAKIENLDRLVNLEMLIVSENQITLIQNLKNLKSLKELNIASNLIKFIGNSLDFLKNLETLNLANNKISHFKEILNINRLPSLKCVNFSDPNFGENPICCVSNYQTFVLYHIPKVQVLDSMIISHDTKAFAEATFTKKRMFYNMKIKSNQCVVSNILKLIKYSKRLAQVRINNNIEFLTKKKNEITKVLDERQFYQIKTQTENKADQRGEEISGEKLNIITLNEYEQKKAVIQSKISEEQDNEKDLRSIYDSVKSKIYEISEENIHRLITELETGGNIRFEEGKLSDKWYKSCSDLIKSRFQSHLMQEFGIENINIARVTRIHNRFLRNQFEEKIETIGDLTEKAIKKNLDFLFLGSDPTNPSSIFKIIEDGFKNVQESELQNTNIAMTNSVSIADIPRIKHYFETLASAKQKKHDPNSQSKPVSILDCKIKELNIRSKGLYKIPNSYMLVCKVFTQKMCHDSHTPIFDRYIPLNNQYSIMPPQFESDCTCCFRILESDQQQKLYFLSDSSFILPEYVVELEYICKNQKDLKLANDDSIKDVFNKMCNYVISARNKLAQNYNRVTGMQSDISLSSTNDEDLERCDLGSLESMTINFFNHCGINEGISNQLSFEPDSNLVDVLKKMPPHFIDKAKSGSIKKELFPQFISALSDDKIKYINFHDSNIYSMENLERFTELECLILPFNHISKIDNLTTLKNLFCLDLGYNQILTIENCESLSKLKQIFLNNNFISNINDLDHLATYCPLISEISVSCNHCTYSNSYRTLVLMHLPNIKIIDMIPVDPIEMEKLKNVGSYMTKEKIYENSKFNEDNITETLLIIDEYNQNTLQSNNSIISKNEDSPNNRRSPKQASKIIGDWEKKVEFLKLCHLKISKIENLNLLVNLRRLILLDNYIGKIEGLESCTLLEELNIYKNRIQVIENLTNLKYIKKLDLGKNKIKFIGGLVGCESIMQLSLEDNCISSLSGLETLYNLMELYIANNCVQDLKEINHIKLLPKLIILDFAGNKVNKELNYRQCIIFNLKKLKVLDGISIEMNEINDSKSLFSGRLTDDLLESRLNGVSQREIIDLDLSSCKIKDFDNIFNESIFPKLQILNLAANNFISLKAFGLLPKLHTLNISANKLETLMCKTEKQEDIRGLRGLPNLENLDVSYNDLGDFYGMQVANLKKLKVLNASNNTITKVEFIDNLPSLRELDLCKNRIRQFDPNSFCENSPIIILKMEENGLKSLNFAERLTNIQVFILNTNRIGDFPDVDRLIDCHKLHTLSLLSNPITRKNYYRLTIVKRLQQLKSLDGKEITEEEQERFDNTILMQQQNIQSQMQPIIHPSQAASLKVAVKINSINFDNVFQMPKAQVETVQPNIVNQQQMFGLPNMIQVNSLSQPHHIPAEEKQSTKSNKRPISSKNKDTNSQPQAIKNMQPNAPINILGPKYPQQSIPVTVAKLNMGGGFTSNQGRPSKKKY